MPGVCTFSDVKVLNSQGNGIVMRKLGHLREEGSKGSRSHKHCLMNRKTNRNSIEGVWRRVSVQRIVKPVSPKTGLW